MPTWVPNQLSVHMVYKPRQAWAPLTTMPPSVHPNHFCCLSFILHGSVVENTSVGWQKPTDIQRVAEEMISYSYDGNENSRQDISYYFLTW
jgi:hypothetical protein